MLIMKLQVNDGVISVQAEDTRVKLESISAAVLENTQELCQCDFTSDRLTDDVFQCFPASPHAVTYRAALHGTASANSAQLISHIEQWTAEGAAVTIQQVLLRVDGSCAVAVSSLVEEECQLRNTRSDLSSSNTIIVTGSITGGAALVTVIITVMIVATITIVRIRKNRLKVNGERYMYFVFTWSFMLTLTECTYYTV